MEKEWSIIVVAVVGVALFVIGRVIDAKWNEKRQKHLAKLQSLASSSDPAERAQAAQGYYELGNKEWSWSRPRSPNISQNDDMNTIRRKEADEKARQMRAREDAVKYWLQAAQLGHQGAYEQLEMVKTLRGSI